MELKQKGLKIGSQSGSIVNWMMSYNSSVPEVGKGATRLSWSDRHPYEVVEVSNDFKVVRLEELDATADLSKRLGEGHQNWILNKSGRFVTVVWRRGAWRTKGTEIHFTKSFIDEHKGVISYARQLTEDQRKAVYAGDIRPQNVVDGITERKTVYHKINIVFGIKEYYYDWSF